MKKLEPGMLCITFGALNPQNNGVVVRLIGRGRLPFDAESPEIKWWKVDRNMDFWSFLDGHQKAPFAPECGLMPINPDHQPADEQWQADFKRMLSGGHKAKEKPLDRSGARGCGSNTK